MDCIMKSWIWLGLITGAFWGITAIFLYARPPLRWMCNKHKEERYCGCWGAMETLFISLNQFFFNFVGGFAGWFFLYLFIKYHDAPDKQTFQLSMIWLLLLAILGISGKLSAIIWELPKSAADFIKVLGDSLSKRISGV